ncbi:MAG TPA: zf-HC2 domain-containing protein [Cystobacter sp.]
MKTQNAHAHEDRLLDFAYDELPLTEARAVEQHLQGCSRCAETLRGIRGVRRSMARLPQEASPEAGLDSLLAYAQQSARRAAAGAEPAPRWWRRLMAPALSMAAVSVFGVVVFQVNRDVDLSPSLQSTAQAPISRAKAEVASAPAPSAAPAQPPLLAEPAPRATPQRTDKPSYASPRGLPPMAKSMPSPATRGRAAEGKASALTGMGGSALKGKRAVDSDDSEPPAESTQGMSMDSAPPPAMAASRDQTEEARLAPSAAPPPPSAPASPPPRVASASPRPEPSKEGVVAEEREVAEGVSASSGRSAARASPSPAELVRQADLALRSGDRSQEAVFLRAALSAGAQGTQALTVLSRLCDAEAALGRRRNAIEVCKRVLATAPGSSEARSALRVLEDQLRSPEFEAGGEVEKR